MAESIDVMVSYRVPETGDPIKRGGDGTAPAIANMLEELYGYTIFLDVKNLEVLRGGSESDYCLQLGWCCGRAPPYHSSLLRAEADKLISRMHVRAAMTSTVSYSVASRPAEPSCLSAHPRTATQTIRERSSCLPSAGKR